MSGRNFIETRDTRFNDQREATNRGITLEEARRLRIRAWLILNHFEPLTDEAWEHPAGTIAAHIEWGVWKVLCPNYDECKGCEIVTPDWPYFVCCSGCGAGPYRVAFPPEIEDVHAELLRRPIPQTRNFLAHRGERLEHLQFENAVKLDGAEFFPMKESET